MEMVYRNRGIRRLSREWVVHFNFKGLANIQDTNIFFFWRLNVMPKFSHALENFLMCLCIVALE